MAATADARATDGTGIPDLPRLPPVTVARFEEATRLLEKLADEQTDRFLDRMQDHRDRHIAATRRPLNPEEAGQIAAALAGAVDEKRKPETIAAQLQKSGLYAYDQPNRSDLLMAAGLATAPAFMQMAQRFTALMELDPGVFEDACEDDTLDSVLDDAVKEMRRADLKADARPRVQAALEHLADAAGTTPGEAWALLTRTVWGALKHALNEIDQSSAPGYASLMGSLEPTDGTDESFSTAPATGTP